MLFSINKYQLEKKKKFAHQIEQTFENFIFILQTYM